jgi:putative DNA-invertase from lambdoid prophage Rac
VQVNAMQSYISDRGWKVARRIEDVRSGAKERSGRELLLKAARRRELEVVWK